MKGSQATDDSGSYGVKGIEATTNLPPARSWGMATWTDTTGNLWMYGGATTVNTNFINDVFSDLWMFNISTNNWTWVKGSKYRHQPPVYGTLGVAHNANTPGARSEAVCTWTDNDNNLWLFGGADTIGKAYADLWKYSIATNKWTWMKGPDSVSAPGVYGTRGVEDSLNYPKARWAFSRWKDANDNFYLFGGNYFSSGYFRLNDLWKYNKATNNWTWIKGPPGIFQDTGIVGNFCVIDSSFNPISRLESRTNIIDKFGNFWLHSGFAIHPSTPYAISLNDLWTYDVLTNEWTFIWADEYYHREANFGQKGIASPCNHPPGRWGGVSWYDPNQHAIYMFGGYQFYPPHASRFRSSMWKYEIDTACIQQICNVTGESELYISEIPVVYPNPTSSRLTFAIDLPSPETVILTLRNITGDIVQTSSENTGAGIFTKEMNLEKLSSGIYILQILSNEKIYFKKIIKQ